MAKIAKPNYVLDTNVLINNPDCLTDSTFSNGHINIPEVVLTELERFKKEDSSRGHASRKVGRCLRDLRLKGDLKAGFKNNSGNQIRAIGLIDNESSLLDGWDPKDPDQMILKTAVQLKESGKKNVTLVTNDIYLAIKADQCGIVTHELYYNDYANVYTGQRSVFCKSEAFSKIISSKEKAWQLSVNDIYQYDEDAQKPKQITDLAVNEFLIIKNELDPGAAKLGRFDGYEVVSLKHERETPSGVIPRNASQTFLQEALITEKDEQRLVIIEGPAGTAKTFYTLAVGIEAKENGIFDKFYVTRANVEADETFGFLPGDMDAKFDSFLNPIYDNLEALLNIDSESISQKDGKSFNPIDDKSMLLKQFGIEAKSLNHMRGRSLKRRLIFVDEAQNLTRSQIKMIITRAGKGSVVVISGDTQQIDTPKLNKFNNGLTHAFTSMVGEKLCWIIRLDGDDNERSELSKLAAKKL